MVKVKTKRAFKDKEAKRTRLLNEEFDVSEERAEVLTGLDFVELVDIEDNTNIDTEGELEDTNLNNDTIVEDSDTQSDTENDSELDESTEDDKELEETDNISQENVDEPIETEKQTTSHKKK